MTTLQDQVEGLWLAWSQRDEGPATDQVLAGFERVNGLLADDGVWWVDCLEATAADAGWFERVQARAGCEGYLVDLADSLGDLAAALDSDGQPDLAEVAAAMLDQAETFEDQTETIVDPLLDLGQWEIPGWMQAAAALAVVAMVARG